MGLRGRFPPPPPPPGPPPPFQHVGNGGSHELVSWLLVALVILLVGVVVYFAVAYASRPVSPGSAAAAPASRHDLLSLVALRYANGEITREEFLRMTADLGGPPVPASEPHPEE
jgi:uncharacterized membrane protein